MDGLRGGEYSFLLLTSNLGDPGRKPLTLAQLRELFRRSEAMHRRDIRREVDVCDLVSIGYSPKAARHILDLLRDEELLNWYLTQAGRKNIIPITRATESYPIRLRRLLGLDAPGCLWGRGDLSLLEKPAVSLVGSRDLREENLLFAQAVGRQAARLGLVLVSGNARGADKAAQNACLEAGGQVISIVADALTEHSPRENLLYLSENSFDEPFSAQRALSRNRCIHTLGRAVAVAQCTWGKGGTWSGTTMNLRRGWTPVGIFDDGSEGARELIRLGAIPVKDADLAPLLDGRDQISLF